MLRKFILLILTAFITLNLNAQNGTCGENLTWRVSNDSLYIEGVGAMEDNAIFSSLWSSYTSIHVVDISNGVTSIGKYAFYNCSNITSIIIPNSMITIDNYAFAYCKGLINIIIPNNVTSVGGSAFLGCSSLTYISIGDNVASIGGTAFMSCSSLTGIAIPASVTSIGDNAFNDCNSLTFIDVDNSNSKYFSDDGVLFDKDKTILLRYPPGKQGTLYIIPNNIINIGYHAFDHCSELITITIPNSVITIRDGAFSGCSGLTSITIGDNVNSIGYNAFGDCSSLTSIAIPASVTSIGDDVFIRCSNLAFIDVNNNNPKYSSDNGILFNKEKTILLRYPPNKQGTSYIIPNNVINIGYQAFDHCSGLISVTIPNSVITISDGAFYYCDGLINVVIPNSVTNIGISAFFSCGSLASITIPGSTTTIGGYAFYNTRLTKIYNQSIVPQKIQPNVFWYVNKYACTLYVPVGSLEAYRNAEVWKDFEKIVEEAPDAIKNPQTNHFSVYPNPAKDIIFIENANGQEVFVYNSAGKLLLRSYKNSIDLSGYPNGIYLLRTSGTIVKLIKF